jgi:hypothetical protein
MSLVVVKPPLGLVTKTSAPPDTAVGEIDKGTEPREDPTVATLSTRPAVEWPKDGSQSGPLAPLTELSRLYATHSPFGRPSLGSPASPEWGPEQPSTSFFPGVSEAEEGKESPHGPALGGA